MSATFVLVPGAGGDAAFWDWVVPPLRAAGHPVIAVELPSRPGETQHDQADQIVAAAAGADEVVLVAQSMAGFSAPLACGRLPVRDLVLLNAMIPTPGETAAAWWKNTGQRAARRKHDVTEGRDPDAEFDPLVLFLHDLPPEVLDSVLQRKEREPADSLFADAYDLAAWPDVPTLVLSGRDDRVFPYEFQRRVTRDRLGLDVEPLPGGHCLAMSRPGELAARLIRTLRSDGG